MINVKVGGKVVTSIPAYFNEFSAQELLVYFELLTQAKTRADFACAWLINFLNHEIIASLTKYELADLAMTIYRNMQSLRKPLTANKFPKITLSKKLVGPADYLGNISFGRYIELEEQYWLYLKTQNAKHLHTLIAILYTFSNERQYDNSLVPERANLIENEMNEAQKLIIFEFYAGCREHITERFERVFPKKNQAKKSKNRMTFLSIQKMKETFNKVMVDFAGTPDRKPEIYNTNLYTVLEFVDRQIEKNEELQRLYGTHK